MKVLLLTTWASGGGAPLAAKRLHFALLQQGVDSTLLSLNRKEDEIGVIEYSQFRKVSLLEKYTKKLLCRFYKWLTHCNTAKRTSESYEANPYTLYLGNIRCYHSLKEILRTWDYDVLHLHWVDGFLDIQDLQCVTKPIVWTLHDCTEFTGGCPHPYQCLGYKSGCDVEKKCPMVGTWWFRSFIIQNVRKKKKVFMTRPIHFISPSHWMMLKAAESALLNNCNISVIHNCIDISLFMPLEKAVVKEKLGLSQHKHYILYGAMNALTDKNKGADLLQQAIEILTDKQNLELLIFGATQDQKVQFDIPTTYLGVVPPYSMPYLYNAADVMLVPSRYENLPGVAVESIACGTKVTAFNVGGMSDIIHHQQNGYLAEAYDVQDFAAGIRWCLSGSNADASMAIANDAANTFNMAHIAKQHIDLYTKLLQR